MIDREVWARVSQVLADPEIIAREVARRRQDGGLERDLAVIEKQLGNVSAKQGRTARAIAAIDDDAAAAPLLAELKALAAQKANLERDRAAMQTRLDDARSDVAKVRDLQDWCQRVHQNLDLMTYDGKRLALEALGVQVRVWRAKTIDENGIRHPRWELTLRPTVSAEPFVYSSTRCNTPRR